MKWPACLAICLAWPAHALELSLPGAALSVQIESPGDSVRLPKDRWQDGVEVSATEGAIRRTVYTVSNPALTTLQLLAPLRGQLQEAGYAEIFSCADAACGGFDFRFQLDLLPAPDMYVDLGNYRYVLLENPDSASRQVGLLASSSSTTGYVHVTEVAETDAFELTTPTQTAPEPVRSPPEGLVAKLIETGHVVLSDLDFATGSADLGPGPFASLNTLAAWLRQETGARVVLVGHTDSVGSLEANAALSRRRATSVLERLVNELGADPDQVQADGAGALSPVLSNLTEAGRSANRRVEVVLLSL